MEVEVVSKLIIPGEGDGVYCPCDDDLDDLVANCRIAGLTVTAFKKKYRPVKSVHV